MIENFWKSWIALLFVAGPFPIIVIGLALNLYLGTRYMDVMLDALKNSRHIVVHGAALRNLGWFGRFLLVNKIAGVMTCSRNLVRAGQVSAEDIRDFPALLRLLIRVHVGLLVLAVIWLVIVYFALKLK
ncbi:hypothetical protein ALP94_03830 [Pseudomonas savastanoi pv. glycinea]|nr:hypothetical protein ALP94_03830 [Pseudomonas savastanoi pv. glycinea]